MPNFRRIIMDDCFYFVTTKTKSSEFVFDNDKYCDFLIKNIEFYRSKLNFLLIAYVILPDHFHGIIVPDLKKGNISDVMRNIKYRTAKDIIEFNGLRDKDTSIVNNGRGRPGLPLRGNKAEHGIKIWQKSFYDRIIRNEKHLNQTIEYIHFNPEKHRFINDYTKWKYSSYRNYYLNDNEVIYK